MNNGIRLYRIRDKVQIQLKDYVCDIQFLDEGGMIKEADLVATETLHMLKDQICTEDVNVYDFGSHVEYMI